MLEIPIFIAFFAGLVSFLSPCVLPLIPAFLSYLAGTNVSESAQNRGAVFVTSVFFVLGFTFVFASLGVLFNTLLQNVAFDVQVWLSRLGGVLIAFFGVYLLGLIKIPFLEQQHKLNVKTFSSKNLTSFLFGAAFAAGWTPCVGAVLGAILGLAATSPGSAFLLLIIYSIGFGIPFLLVGAFTAQATGFISRYQKLFSYIRVVFGAILVGIGILVFTQTLQQIASVDQLLSIFVN